MTPSTLALAAKPDPRPPWIGLAVAAFAIGIGSVEMIELAGALDLSRRRGRFYRPEVRALAELRAGIDLERRGPIDPKILDCEPGCTGPQRRTADPPRSRAGGSAAR